MTKTTKVKPGTKTREGAPCPKDGTTLKYVSNRCCVACTKAKSKRQAEKKAENRQNRVTHY